MIILDKTIQEHDKCLDEALRHIHVNGMKINPKKYIFAVASLIFSGHKPSDEISSGPEKVIGISSMTSL